MSTVTFTRSGLQSDRELIPALTKVARIAIRELLPDADDLDVSIRFKKLNKLTHASTEPRKSKNKFMINLSKEGSFNIRALYLCHELVHVKQMHEGQLQLSPCRTEVTWICEESGSKTYGCADTEHNGTPESFERYKSLPWEAEAYSKAEELYAICKKELADEKLDLGAGFLIPLFSTRS